MRYTTAIDITEIPSVWRSASASRLYVWACMCCGYHDNDRDQLTASLRQMATGTGMSLSAVRCAIQALVKAKLLTRQDNSWLVTKWVPEGKVTKRPQKAAGVSQNAFDVYSEEHQRRREQEAEDRARLEARKDVLRAASPQDLERLRDAIVKSGGVHWKGYQWTAKGEVEAFIRAKSRQMQ